MNAIIAGSSTVVTDGVSYPDNGTIPPPWPSPNPAAGVPGIGPKVFLTYLMFDKDFNPIPMSIDPTQTNRVQLSDAPKEHGQDVNHEKLSATVTVKQPGYIYIFTSATKRRRLWRYILMTLRLLK